VHKKTVAIYERAAATYAARRRRPNRALAAELRRRAGRRQVCLDLGCGPGLLASALGYPALAIDAAFPMLVEARHRASKAWMVRADLEALPLRRGRAAGALAVKSYQHLPRVRLPLALARLHDALSFGAPLALQVFAGAGEGPWPSDDIPGRFFALWQPDELTSVLVGAGFGVDSVSVHDHELVVHARRLRTLPDVVGPAMRVLICGLNPSLYAADAGVGFARPGNRFWPAALAAGLVTRSHDPCHALGAHRIGMTDLVKRSTASAGELKASEFEAGAERVERLVRWLRPQAVCFVGLAGWRAAVDRRASIGLQPTGFGGVPAYVMPSTSGRNAHADLSALVGHLRAAARLAGSRAGAGAASRAGAGAASRARPAAAGGSTRPPR